MIHDDENARRARRASAGRDGNVRSGPVVGVVSYGSASRSDVDSLERRVEVLEAFCERLQEKLREKGFDLEEPIQGASAVAP